MKFNCIHCEQSLDADSDMAGTSVTCPACSKNITVPVPKDQPIKIGRFAPPPVPPAAVTDASPLNTGLQPRSYFGTASMLFGVTSLPFALGFGFLMSLQTGTPFGSLRYPSLPASCLVFSGIMAAFLKEENHCQRPRQRLRLQNQRGHVPTHFNPATDPATS